MLEAMALGSIKFANVEDHIGLLFEKTCATGQKKCQKSCFLDFEKRKKMF